MSGTIEILNGLAEIMGNDELLIGMKRVLSKHHNIEMRLAESFSIGQIQSKNWLIKHLPTELGTVYVCAGWYGVLPLLMFRHIQERFDKIRSFDIDAQATKIAEDLNRSQLVQEWRFKATTFDIHDMDYDHFVYETERADGSLVQLTEVPNTIINTSCEHIDNFNEWYEKIPYGKLVALQTNDYFEHGEHINCVTSLREFTEITPMSIVHYEGTLELPLYRRFMRIGIK